MTGTTLGDREPMERLWHCGAIRRRETYFAQLSLANRRFLDGRAVKDQYRNAA